MLKEWIQAYHEAEKEDRDPKHLGLSAVGKCGRQLAYRYHREEGIPLHWRARSIFSDGHYIQDQLRQWLHMSPHPDCYHLVSEEAEVELQTPKGRTIKGHLDGVIAHMSPELVDCKDATHHSSLLEIKSMSSTGFRMLRREGLEKSYIAQVSSYLMATKLPEAIVLAKCKDTSDLAELTMKADEAAVTAGLVKFDAVIDSDRPDSVQRMYGPNEDGRLPWQCGFCPFWEKCWADYKPIEKEKHKITLTGDYKEA